MRLRVTKLADGPGLGEVVIGVTTTAGATEQVVVHVAGMEGNTIDVGYPLASDEEQKLVELPRETVSGKWRLWVPQSSMVE